MNCIRRIHFKSSGIVWWIIFQILLIFFVVHYRGIRRYWSILIFFIIYTIWQYLKSLVLYHFTKIFFTFILLYTFAFYTDNRLSKRPILRFRPPFILPFSIFQNKHLLFTFPLWTVIKQFALPCLLIWLIHILNF